MRDVRERDGAVPDPVRIQERTIIFEGRINPEVMERIKESLLYLVSKDKDAHITLRIIDSSGDVAPGLALWGVISSLGTEVRGEVVHEANSIAALVLQACAQRLAYPSAGFTIHDNEVVMKGTVKDFRRHFDGALAAEEKLQREVCEIFAQRINKSVQEIERQCGKAVAMTAKEALEFGLIDKIIEQQAPVATNAPGL